jgi:uncharacterized protein (TIGR03435 family)
MRITLPFAALCAATAVFAQSFEVASVKLSAQPAGAPSMREDGAQFAYTNVPLMMLLMRAYGVKYRQIEGPEWLAGARYDVIAKLPEGASRDQVPKMLRALLAERFRLAVHLDSRTVRGYALTRGKDALRMKTAEGGDGAHRMKTPMGIEIKGNTTMAKLAELLADALDCPVVDETALPGSFAVDLNWAPEENPGVSGPAVASAVQEELGLKLEARKYPGDFLAIDRVERIPTGN